MMRLIFTAGGKAGTEINTSAQRIRIGRDPAHNDLVLDDPTVSSRHVVLERSPRGDYVLEDLGTTNGTLVNGHQVTTVGQLQMIYLSAGDRFCLGTTEIEVGEGSPRFMIIGGPKAGRNVPIADETITFGRAPDTTIEFDDAKVSAYHAAMLCLPSGFVLRDNNSTNGTLVNGHRIQEHVLDDGDTIHIGDNELRFLIDQPEHPAAERAHAGADEGVTYAHLTFVSGPHEGESIPISDDQVIMGRREDCTFSVSDLQVSGMHCAITRTENGFVITDLQSSNGTFLNGRRLTESKALNPGDLIQFGQCVGEFLVAGGVSMNDSSATTATTIMMTNKLAVEAFMPKFVLGDVVVAALSINIGSDANSQLWLRGEGVERLHATVNWEDGFVLQDHSRNGTYVSDKRIVREKLRTGHVIRIGENLINATVRGDRCNLELIDAVAAMAAIEVAREHAFDLRQAQPDAANTGWMQQEQAYKTVFKLDLPDLDALVNERKEKLKTGAPAWRPSTDILRDALGRYAVLGTVAASVAVCALLFVTSSDAALMNHPVSEGHASVLFARQAEEKGLTTGCQSCHSMGSGVPVEKCVACHEDYDVFAREEHVFPPREKMRPEQSSPGNQCASCHIEHTGTRRSVDPKNPSLLHADDNCSSASCHPDQHSETFVRTSQPAPLVLKAGPVPDFKRPQEQFHADHAQVEYQGKKIGIGCTACHAAKNQAGDLVPAPAGLSCFRCHKGGEEHVNSQCASCHGDEHAGVTRLSRTRDAELIKSVASAIPTGTGSLGFASGLVAVAFAPFLLVALIRRSRRRRRTEAMVTRLREFPVETVKRLVHSINRDKCVGCSLCVQACPASVLELVNHKSTVVNFDACIQCRKCENACAFDALRMHDADKPPPMIPMPQVDGNFETPVAGMYLIGQAAGTPQVKNASNLGTAVVYHMVREGGLQPGMGRRMGAQTDVVIVGSGPAGLSAAIACIELGLEYTVLEKQRDFSWTIRNYYHKGKPVMAEPNHIDMAGKLPHWDTVREELLQTWAEWVQHYSIDIKYNSDVTDVKKDGDVFAVTISDTKKQPSGSVTGARVVLAIGTMGNPRKLGCPGDDLEKVANALVDPDEFRGQNILIVGGTDSAIEVVLALCEHNKVWLSTRGARFAKVKPKNLQAIEKVIEEGKCTPLHATVVKEVGPDQVTLEYKSDKRQEQIPNDHVFAMIGGHPPVKWLQSIGVPYIDKPHSWSPPRTDELVKKYAG
ncbi:MAG: FHA domain-containing protein [Proteobacteria bacterium]|nr:FHA domain-containing protein [Pseudomonadota bacterium]